MQKNRYTWALLTLGLIVFSCSETERDFLERDEDAAGGRDDGASGEAASDAGTGAGGYGGGGEDGDLAGAAGDSALKASPPVLSTQALPGADFNAAYDAELVVNGTAPIVFELSEGALPDGLTLTRDGHVTGTALEDGTFQFTVTASNDAGEDSAELSLFVSRKPWLVYLGDDDVEGQMTLYAIDTSSALLTKSVISTDLPPTASVSAFEFAANGSRLAYTADVTTNDVLELYVVDVAQDALGDAVKVNTQDLPVGHFALTPTGDGIAYQVETANDVWEMRFQDLTDMKSDFVPIGSSMPPEAWHQMSWVNAERLVYTTLTANATRARSGDSFGDEEPLAPGSMTVYRDLEHVTTRQGFGTCSMVTWLYDCADGVTGYRAPAAQTNYAVYSHDLELVTLVDGSGGHFVFDATATGGEPMGLISPTGFCADVVWSPRNDRLVTTGPNYQFLQLTNIVAGKLQTARIGGDYEFNGTPGMSFVTDDSFLFTTRTGVREFLVEDGAATDAMVVVPESAEASSVGGLTVSGNGRWAYYAVSLLDGAGHAPFLLDLTRERPITPRAVRPPVPSGLFAEASFSPDSSGMIVEMTDLGTGSETLYFTNLLHASAPGTKLNFGGCKDWCPQVQRAQFQP